jgi:hypothetical protein
MQSRKRTSENLRFRRKLTTKDKKRNNTREKGKKVNVFREGSKSSSAPKLVECEDK